LSDGNNVLTRDEIDRAEIAFRDLIRHENDLVNQRLTWLIQSQGLLFTALGASWANGLSSNVGLVLSPLGIGAAISIWLAISFYSPTVRSLQQAWVKFVPEEERKRRFVIGTYAPSSGIGKMLRPWRALPPMFILAWCGVALLCLRKAGFL